MDIFNESLDIVDQMWDILSNEIADELESEVMDDIKIAIPKLESYLNRLKALSNEYIPGK